jgi:hypothetical protein
MKKTMALDRATREAIAAAVEKAITAKMETYEEVWLTREQLKEKFGMITESWLERFGNTIPQERLEVVDEKTGKVTSSRVGYPWHRINRWISERGHKAVVLCG